MQGPGDITAPEVLVSGGMPARGGSLVQLGVGSGGRRRLCRTHSLCRRRSSGLFLPPVGLGDAVPSTKGREGLTRAQLQGSYGHNPRRAG